MSYTFCKYAKDSKKACFKLTNQPGQESQAGTDPLVRAQWSQIRRQTGQNYQLKCSAFIATKENDLQIGQW